MKVHLLFEKHSAGSFRVAALFVVFNRVVVHGWEPDSGPDSIAYELLDGGLLCDSSPYDSSLRSSHFC